MAHGSWVSSEPQAEQVFTRAAASASASASGVRSCSRRLSSASAARLAERGPSPGSLARRPIRRSISGPAELAKAIPCGLKRHRWRSGVRIVEIADADIEPVVALWERCGLTRPWTAPRADIALARLTASATVLVGWDGETLLATALAGSDGHRGWVYYLAVDPESQRAGLG